MRICKAQESLDDLHMHLDKAKINSRRGELNLFGWGKTPPNKIDVLRILTRPPQQTQTDRRSSSTSEDPDSSP